MRRQNRARGYATFKVEKAQGLQEVRVVAPDWLLPLDGQGGRFEERPVLDIVSVL